MKGHIRERSPGRWAIVLDLQDPATGKRRRKWHKFKGTKREAQIECAKLVSEMSRGTYLEPSKTTLSQYFDRWLEHIKARVSPKTFARYDALARKNICPLIGGTILTNLRPTTIASAYEKALTEGRRDGKGGLSAQTVTHMHRLLKLALNDAVSWEMLTRNPADGVKPPKVLRAPMQTYDLEQTAELIAVLRGTRTLMPVLLAVLCGLRRGEVAALRWRNVDLKAGKLSVVESAEQVGATVRYKRPKSGKGRVLALSSTMVDELRVHRVSEAKELSKLEIWPDENTFVVAQADGKPLQPDSITQDWTRKIADTKLPAIRFHDLRHAHATHLLSSGVHPKVASERLGHSKIGITLDLYSHVLPGMQEDAAARVDEALQAAISKRLKVIR